MGIVKSLLLHAILGSDVDNDSPSIGDEFDVDDISSIDEATIPDMPADFDNGDDGMGTDVDDSAIAMGGSDVSFKGFSGFIDKHKTIRVEIMGGGGMDSLEIYSKPGSNAVWASDGTCTPVCLSGHSWVKIGSHKFNVSDIMKRL